MQDFTEEQIKEVAAQLRKPSGDNGKEIGKLMNVGNATMNLHTLAILNPQSNDSILEIGMGNGFFVKNILNLDPSITYTGCDYSELMIQESIGNNQSYIDSKRASFIHGEIEKLPFDSKTFNKAFTINTMYFWENPKKALFELNRILKTDGQLIIAIRPKHNIENFPMGKYGFTKYECEDVIQLLEDNHFTNFNVTEIKEPENNGWGDNQKRESLIISARKN